MITTSTAGLSHRLSTGRDVPRAYWNSSAAVVFSVAIHVSLLALFLDYKSHKLPEIDQAGNAGSAFSVMAMNPVSLPEAATGITEPVMVEPVIKTVVAQHAEIVVPQKKTIPTPPTEKKTVEPRPVTKRVPEELRIKPPPASITTQKHPIAPVSAPGPATSQATTDPVGSGGNTAKAGESTAGQAVKGAGTTTSTAFHILNRRVNYPTRARSMGVEGRVKVQYDVSASGTIKNIRILAEDPPEVFSGDLRRDMLRWRYDTTGEIKDQIVTVVFKIDGRIQLIN